MEWKIEAGSSTLDNEDCPFAKNIDLPGKNGDVDTVVACTSTGDGCNFESCPLNAVPAGSQRGNQLFPNCTKKGSGKMPGTIQV